MNATDIAAWRQARTPHTAAFLQDPATKCTDPADRDAVIRDLRIEKNCLLCIINSIRGDAEAAHRKIEGALEHRDSERLREARDAIQNIIESIGVKP
ncbi:MAG: hypothetical protein KAJ03_11620 [Gammaproteobacteria bacterium]|nr:hypothetical protein [Gammaproteobacteria bacterium]